MSWAKSSAAPSPTSMNQTLDDCNGEVWSVGGVVRFEGSAARYKPCPGGFGFPFRAACEVLRSRGAAEDWVEEYGAGSSELSDKDAEKHGLPKSLGLLEIFHFVAMAVYGNKILISSAYSFSLRNSQGDLSKWSPRRLG